MPSPEELLQTYIQSGLRAHNQGDIHHAQEAYQQALALAPDNADALNLLGTALLQLGQAEQAIEYLRRAARGLRNHPGVIGNLAQAYFALGRYEESRETFRKASRLDPREARFQLGIATSLAMEGKFAEAETLLRRLVDRFPDNALVWFNLGNVLRDRKRPEEAIESYGKALALDPQLIDARNNLGGVLHALQRFEDAEREYRTCVETAPDYILAQCNLASVIMDLGRFHEAEALCREIVGLAPNMAEAHTLLGAALGHLGRQLEAFACHEAAAKISPQSAKVVMNYAAALIETGDVGEGLRWFARALTLDADSDAPHQILGSALLAHGCLVDGWVEYGYRPALKRFREKYPDIALSRTLPSDLNGRHVCVLREQGLGDEIFFLRYARQLRESGARITYRASNKIRSILARVPCIGEVLEENAPLPRADAAILAGDLPHALAAIDASALPRLPLADSGFRLPDPPRRISIFWPRVEPSLVLTPLDARIADIRERLDASGDPPYLGLTWRGGVPPHEQRGVTWTLYKEIGIPLLAQAVKDVPGTFIALQRKPETGEIDAFSAALGRPLCDFTDLNEDLEGMLALLALIDEYVGVSNTNMHLRAGVGKTARVLLPCPAEWRWMEWGRTSPWFPGFLTYRQSLQGDWRPALAILKRELKDVCP
jgi:Flp pilus assembly protein TadD